MTFRIIEEKSQYHRYAFESPYSKETVAFCRHLKDLYGWQEFSYSDDKWRFSDTGIVTAIQNRFPSVIIDPGIEATAEKQAVNEVLREIKEEKALELHSAKTSAIKLAGVKGKPYPFQKIGVEFFINNNGRAILADQMGTGKTLQVLAYLSHTKKKRSLVVCPASVKYAWESETIKWTSLIPYVVTPKTNPREIPYDANVIIVNYDVLRKHFNWLMTVRWDSVIGDECHLLKNSQAQRTKAFKAITKNVDSVLLLSGTPMLSRPIELWNALQMMDPKYWNNWYDYSRRYCGGYQSRFGWDSSGATNIEELEKKIKRYFLRRTKDDVLKDLPKKVFIDQEVDLPDQYRKEYKMAEEQFVKYLREYKKKGSAYIASALQAEKLVKINMLRQIACMGKLSAAIELIQNVIDSGQKVLVFSSFNAPLEQLQKEFPQAVMITGKTPIENRKGIIEKFQLDKSANIFLGGFQSAGIGITLTAASCVVFLDQSWNPADMQQAQDRVHRPGQTAKSVTIYQLFTKNTIDDFMRKLLVSKQKIFDVLIEGKKEEKDISTKEFIDEVLLAYSNKLKV